VEHFKIRIGLFFAVLILIVNGTALAAGPVPVRVFVGETDLPIVQQPAGNPAFVSNGPTDVTQFSLAANYGTLGLLAHNHLIGEEFLEIRYFQRVGVEFSDGSVEHYRVIKIDKFQALSPTSVTSDFLRLPEGEFLTVTELFTEVYAPGRPVLVLQTCIEEGGNLSWGRLFVTAVPVTELLK
jgi:hypothetical protein